MEHLESIHAIICPAAQALPAPAPEPPTEDVFGVGMTVLQDMEADFVARTPARPAPAPPLPAPVAPPAPIPSSSAVTRPPSSAVITDVDPNLVDAKVPGRGWVEDTSVAETSDYGSEGRYLSSMVETRWGTAFVTVELPPAAPAEAIVAILTRAFYDADDQYRLRAKGGAR
jgi:hypothetical protein